MADDIRLCDKCKHIRIKTLRSKLAKLAEDAVFKIGCKSYCGPCSRSAFIYINGRYVTAPTEAEVIEKIKKYVKS